MKSYEYNGIKIYNNNEDGYWYIYNKKRKIIFSTDVEAEEYINELLDEETKELDDEYVYIDYNLLFNKYCNKLPGRIVLEGKIATTNEKALKNFINSFSKAYEVDISYNIEYRGGEYFYIVQDI